MDVVSEDLLKEFSEVVKRGNEDDAKKFLAANLRRFPKDVQDQIISAFFEEALLAKADDARAVSDFQKQGLEAIGALEKGKKKLEEKQKLLDIKDGIQ